MHPKVIVMIPTYNEAENISSLLDSILTVDPELEVVVVDDDSPDGTWQIVSDKSKSNSHIHLLHRKKDRGRGKAGIAGFRYALDNGADFIVEMDGDFSHEPKFIPFILDASKTADVVLGSRYVKGGRDCRGALRRFLSSLAGFYIKTILGFHIKDPTSGYRCFNRDILKRIDLDSLKANNPFIVTEVLYRCHKERAKIKEIPIVFKDREKGASKLGVKILISNLWKVLMLRIRG